MARRNYSEELIELAPGRYRVYGFPPMTGLMLNKWIQVGPRNTAGCYGAADIPIAGSIPNILKIEDEAGQVVWQSEEG